MVVLDMKNLLKLAEKNMNKKMTSKQQKILQVSIKLFAQKGYAATSTSEIAKEAGVAEGTIFKHFQTKENLLLSVMVPFLIDAVPSIADELIEDVLKNNYDSFEEFLRTLITNRLEFIGENKEVFKIIISELLHRKELQQEIMLGFQHRVLKHLTLIIDSYKEKGYIRDIETTVVIKMMLTHIIGCFIFRFALFSDANVDHSNDVEEMVQFILKGVGKQ